MRRHAVLALVPLLALTACGSPQAPAGTPPRSGAGQEVTAEPSPTATPVSPAVARINGLTDCTLLQDEFDTAERNGRTDYMELADARMREVGCY